jgi:hypothetical protein
MRSRLIVFFLLFSLTSCSLLTKSGRQQRAYEKYIRKSSVVRQRQRSKFRGTMTMPLRPSEPSTITETRPQSPESVTASESEPSPQ